MQFRVRSRKYHSQCQRLSKRVDANVARKRRDIVDGESRHNNPTPRNHFGLHKINKSDDARAVPGVEKQKAKRARS